MQTRYPSPEEIMNHENLTTEKQYDIIMLWRVKYYNGIWSFLSVKDKCVSLGILAQNLIPKHIRLENINKYACNIETMVLYFDKDKPSIISTLHEVGHLLMGASELKACAFSYQLFRRCFPNEISRLQWQGHMLVKKSS